jgi:hypothetical protein
VTEPRPAPLPPVAEALLFRIAKTATAEDLRFHGLDALAAAPERAPDARATAAVEAAAARDLAVGAVLSAVRDALTGEIVLMKGPEIACRYPVSVPRPFGDVDLLVADPVRAQAQLLDAGFRPVGDSALYTGIHHRQPLQLGEIPVPVELHDRPKWIPWSDPPAWDELLAVGRRASVAVPGFLAPRDSEHAVLVAVHAWAHEPLQRIRDLLDVEVLLAAADRALAASAARRWGVARLWDVTTAAADALFRRGGVGLPVWARHLARGTDRTVLESHLQRWLSGLAGAPARFAVRQLPEILAAEIGRTGSEPWSEKAARVARAARRPRRGRLRRDE